MSKSLFIPYNSLSEYQMTMDNLVMAKLLHDNQISVPDIPIIRQYKEDSIFHHALSLLFQSVICHEDERDHGETVVISLRSPLIQEWVDLARSYPDEELDQRLESIFDPVQECWDDYFNGCTKTEITHFGLKITISGGYSFFHHLLELFIECKQCLEQELGELKIRKGESENGRNFDNDARGYEISPYCTAV